MPEKATLERARKDARQGKSASTQAGEFVREEIHHVREGKHGVRSARQAIAIGLSKARRAGVALPPPARGKASNETRKAAARDLKKAKQGHKPSSKRSKAASRKLRHEGHSGASSTALARHAKAVARTRTKKDRSAQARRAARTRRSQR